MKYRNKIVAHPHAIKTTMARIVGRIPMSHTPYKLVVIYPAIGHYGF